MLPRSYVLARRAVRARAADPARVQLGSIFLRSHISGSIFKSIIRPSDLGSRLHHMTNVAPDSAIILEIDGDCWRLSAHWRLETGDWRLWRHCALEPGEAGDAGELEKKKLESGPRMESPGEEMNY